MEESRQLQAKACSPMSTTEAGSTTSVSPLQRLKAALPIDFKPGSSEGGGGEGGGGDGGGGLGGGGEGGGGLGGGGDGGGG